MEASRLAYSPVVADLFHYGHLQVLKTAAENSDYHVCGVITDEAANTYRPEPVSNYEEREAVVESIEYVDEVMRQDSRDPTENLRELHQRHPDAELLLVHGDDWKDVPGREFVESVGGRVVQPSYYERLSDDRITEAVGEGQVQSQHYELFTEHFRVDDVEYFTGASGGRILSTKADTLKSLQPRLDESRIEETFVFDVGDWRDDTDSVVKGVRDKFEGDTVVVRSSSVNEDTMESSNAGNFESVLDVDSSQTQEVRDAVDEVVESYEDDGVAFVDDQVLVQRQTEDVQISGVVFTRGLETGSPYYVVNYDESGDTEAVTSGEEAEKLRVFRGVDSGDLPRRWRSLLDSVREIEDVVPDVPLDIEFGMDADDRVTVFQVRPLTANSREEAVDSTDLQPEIEQMTEEFRSKSEPRDHLAGDTNAFSDMAFWNPAEMIGERPGELAYSLYSYLITDEVWHQALTPLGYTDVEPAELMVEFGGKPYIDLRATFNALTPRSVPVELREKLVEHYLHRLREDPALHDKIEFQLVYNCYTFDIDERARELEEDGFTNEEVEHLKNSLKNLTEDLLSSYEQLIQDADLDVEEMVDKRDRSLQRLETTLQGDAEKKLEVASDLLEDCRDLGTPPFSRLARMAFVGKALLESVVDEDALDEERYKDFLSSIETVASEFERDFRRYAEDELPREEFMERYGHLRPGTYDVTVPPYRDNPGLLETEEPTYDKLEKKDEEQPEFTLTEQERNRIQALLDDHGVESDVETLMDFVRESVKGRERLKFEFTRNLSEVLELVAEAGEDLGLSRDDLSHLEWNELVEAVEASDATEAAEELQKTVEERREEARRRRSLALPPVVFSSRDFYMVPTYTVRPNFVTDERVVGEVVDLDSLEDESHVDGKIALVENADPGYDWIFTREIEGLITKYGGEASHMAIRAVEFGLPAAVGCGRERYRKAMEASQVVLDCGNGKLEFRGNR